MHVPFGRQNARQGRLFQPLGKTPENPKRRPGGKACGSRPHQHQFRAAKRVTKRQSFSYLHTRRATENHAADDADRKAYRCFPLAMRQHIGQRNRRTCDRASNLREPQPCGIGSQNRVVPIVHDTLLPTRG